MTSHCDAANRDVDQEAGFTLVELLVALALFSLLVTLLSNNVGTGLQAWRHGSQYADELGRRGNVQDTLRRLIGNLYPMAVTDSGGIPRMQFEGANNSISFLAGAPVVVSAGGQFRYRIFAEQQRGKTDLVLSAVPELGDASASTRSILLSDIADAEFSYFGGDPTERHAKWQDGWQRRADIPRLVRLRVSFRSDDVRSWPELLIAPRILADVGCVYDPATMRCRGR